MGVLSHEKPFFDNISLHHGLLNIDQGSMFVECILLFSPQASPAAAAHNKNIYAAFFLLLGQYKFFQDFHYGDMHSFIVFTRHHLYDTIT